MNEFWHSRCLKDGNDLTYIELYASGTTAYLVAKNKTKKYFTTVDKII